MNTTNIDCNLANYDTSDLDLQNTLREAVVLVLVQPAIARKHELSAQTRSIDLDLQ